MILVGDSLGMTMLGYDCTLPVTMDDMIRHAAAVRRGAPNAWVVGDMPYMSYQPSVETAIRNAGRFMAEAGCDAVKLEGGAEMADRVAGIARAGIPVIGHLGLTPQSVERPGRLPAPGQERRAGEEDRGRRAGARGGRRVLHPARAGARPRLRLITERAEGCHHHEPGLRARRPRPAADLPRRVRPLPEVHAADGQGVRRRRRGHPRGPGGLRRRGHRADLPGSPRTGSA